MSEEYVYPRIVPQLVEDNSLKRARTTIIEGGEEKEAIQVTQVGGSADAQTIADGMGKMPSSVDLGSVSSELQNIFGVGQNIEGYNSSMTDSLSEIKGSLGPIGSNTGILKHSEDISEVLGSTSDPFVTIQDGSISARLRGLAGLTSTIFSSCSAIDAFSERISNATGTRSDTAWSGSGDGSVIALLKGIYNKL